ncbi:hypothetical protein [Sphingomonas sp. Leaf231]|uniref:hypothetical protein n=1 Tax=Sphingomonas sp. Leaf231 TaxID=1736301 RepID=UPI001F41D182|nr:hypothetical protein [Sphingomonas sp. Leaf231]
MDENEAKQCQKLYPGRSAASGRLREQAGDDRGSEPREYEYPAQHEPAETCMIRVSTFFAHEG